MAKSPAGAKPIRGSCAKVSHVLCNEAVHQVNGRHDRINSWDKLMKISLALPVLVPSFGEWLGLDSPNTKARLGISNARQHVPPTI